MSDPKADALGDGCRLYATALAVLVGAPIVCGACSLGYQWITASAAEAEAWWNTDPAAEAAAEMADVCDERTADLGLQVEDLESEVADLRARVEELEADR